MVDFDRKDGVLTLLRLATEKAIDFLGEDSSEFDAYPTHVKDLARRILISVKREISPKTLSSVLHDRVTFLDLSECIHIDETHILALKRSPYLRKLDLNSTGLLLTDPQKCFEPLQHLSILYMRATHITDFDLSIISQCCPRLREIDLGRCSKVGDEGVAVLGQNCELLEAVNLCRTNVTDAGIADFVQGGMKEHLAELRIDGCVQVTDEGVFAILECCPKLRILIFHNCPKITGESRQALQDYLQEKQIPMKQIMWTIY